MSRDNGSDKRMQDEGENTVYNIRGPDHVHVIITRGRQSVSFMSKMSLKALTLWQSFSPKTDQFILFLLGLVYYT